jgi:hypothetical protein
MLKAMTIKAAIVAPTILERANRGPDIPRFQRPTSKAQRPRPNEKREVENPNTEHRTPNGDFCGIITCCVRSVVRTLATKILISSSASARHATKRGSRFIFLSRDASHDGRMSMFRI